MQPNGPKFDGGFFETLQPIKTAPKFGNSTYGNIITGINTGLGVYQAAGGGHGGSGGHGSQQCRAPSGCFQCAMSGQGDIAGCIDLLVAQYHQIEQQGDINTTLVAAQGALTALNNPAYFSGTSQYLTDARAVFVHAIAVLQGNGAVSSGGSSQLPNGGSGGGLITGGSGVIGSIPNSYLLAGIAALGAIFLLSRKKA